MDIYHGRKETGTSKYLTLLSFCQRQSHFQASKEKETSQWDKVEAEILNYKLILCRVLFIRHLRSLADFEPP